MQTQFLRRPGPEAEAHPKEGLPGGPGAPAGIPGPTSAVKRGEDKERKKNPITFFQLPCVSNGGPVSPFHRVSVETRGAQFHPRAARFARGSQAGRAANAPTKVSETGLRTAFHSSLYWLSAFTKMQSSPNGVKMSFPILEKI